MNRNYADPQYKEWRNKVLTRDKYRCQWPHCHHTNKIKLHCHHIKRWADCPALRFSVDNGITLCATHHKLIKDNEDSYIGYFYTILKAKK